MTLPNLVIAGAPKCGTTSLFTWLIAHPEVCGSNTKEPFFLMDADHPLRRRDCNFHDHGVEAYASCFPDCTPRHKIVVEATTHYFYQETALEVLASLATRPRVLFLLRKPSERLFSSFAYSRNNLANVRVDLSFADFVKLIRDGSDRAALERGLGASAYVLARELNYSRYIDYLSAWRERLGEDRVRVMLLESLRVHPKAEIEALCSWLGIDASFYAAYDFSARNPTVTIRSRKVQRLARALSSRLPLGQVKGMLKRFYLAVQAKPQGETRTKSDEATLAELDEEFRPYNERLAREFGLNLDAWR